MSAVCVLGAIILLLFVVIWVLIQTRPRAPEQVVEIRVRNERRRGWF